METERKNGRSRERRSKEWDKWLQSLARIRKYSFLSSAMRRLFEKAVQKSVEACTGGLTYQFVEELVFHYYPERICRILDLAW